MKNKIKILIILAGMLMINMKIFALDVTIKENSKKIQTYGLFELDIKADLEPANFYNYDETRIEAVFKSPDNKTMTVDGFYCRNFNYDKTANSYAPGDEVFKVRFSPTKQGKWSYQLKIYKTNQEIYESKWLNFSCAGSKGEKGYIRISKEDPLFMEFGNKEPFYAYAMDICWPKDRGFLDYTDWLDKFTKNGGNMIRVWMAPWSYEIEWDGKLRNYESRQQQAYALDQLISLCEQKGVYVELCLVPHGDFSLHANSKWDDNPYNVKNGGILEKPDDFFTDDNAMLIFKNKLRYIIARWAYSTHIFAWELCNEVDLTENYDSEITSSWHREMFDYISKYDIYRHLKTTSFADPYKEEIIWNLKGLDFTQTHIYGLKQEAEEICDISKYKIETFSKPHIVSEYGIDTTPDFIAKGLDKDGINIHNSIWAGAFTLSFGTPMTWWWDNYVAPNNFFRYYKPLYEFTKKINRVKSGFYDLKNTDVFLNKNSGTKPVDLVIYPTDSWARPIENKFIINNDGKIDNKRFLISFLQGDANSKLKNDPVFYIKNDQPVKFTVTISGVSNEADFAAYLNGQELTRVSMTAADFPQQAKYVDQWKIYQATGIDKEVVIEVPRGDNEIKFSNPGKDWLQISSIKIENFMSSRLAPVFVTGLQNSNSAYIWAKNSGYSWEHPSPDPVEGAYLEVADLVKGRYVIKFYDTYAGKVTKIKEDILDRKGMKLKIELPVIKTDYTISVEKYKKGK